MRISAKGRYALAAMIDLAQNYDNGEYITVISISDRLGISKMYLEQVFSLLKRANLVDSVKGAQGGYHLARMPRQISVFDILSSVENSLFENTEETVKANSPDIEATMHISIFKPLTNAVKSTLEQISLSDLLNEAEKHKKNQAQMFFI